MCLGVSKARKQLVAQSTSYALRNRQGKQEFVKEKKNKTKNEKKKSKSVKSLSYMDDSPDFSLLESCQLFIIAKYKVSNCYEIKAVIYKCSVKKGIFKNLAKFTEKPMCQSLFFNKAAA